MTWPTWITELIPAAPWLAALAILAFVGVKLWPIGRKLGHLIGEPARPGVEARPGLMERIANVEATQNDMQSKPDAVHHDGFPHSGNSLRDRVERIGRKLDNATAASAKSRTPSRAPSRRRSPKS